MTRLARPAVLLSCALAIPLAACGEAKKTQAESTETAVQVVRITENAGVSALRDYAGIIRPRREADMAFRAGGRIIARDVDLGARVRQGQTLARLDPADLSLQKRSAEADLASAEAQAVQALADGRRSSQLLAGGWASNQADEIKQAMAKAAQERVISARAALQLARNRLDYAMLTAPRDGVITATLADPGTVVSEGQPVVRLAETGALEVEVALPETAIGADQQGGEVAFWARPGQRLKATLRELSPSADARLRTYTARFTLESQPDWLAIGMSATLSLGRVSEKGLSLIPLAALADRGQGQMVWVVKASGQLEARRVELRQLRRETAVVTGLTPGEEVVAMGVQKLDPALRVRVADRKTITE